MFVVYLCISVFLFVHLLFVVYLLISSKILLYMHFSNSVNHMSLFKKCISQILNWYFSDMIIYVFQYIYISFIVVVLCIGTPLCVVLVCISVFVYLCICIFVYLYICVFVYLCICVFVYLCICVFHS